MTDTNRWNRREILAGVSGIGSVGIAGCTGGSSAGGEQGDGRTEESPDVGKYGLPHCDSGEYAFQILEIEKGNSVEYPNFVAKNLTTDRVEIFSVIEDGDEYFVEVIFEPKETKTVVIEGTGFGPTSNFRLNVNGLDGSYDGMKCSEGSPSEEYENQDTHVRTEDLDKNDNGIRDSVEDAMNEADSQDRVGESKKTEEPTAESTTTSEPEITVEPQGVYSYGSTDIQVSYKLINEYEIEKPVEIELRVTTSTGRIETSTQSYTVKSGGETSISVEFENPDLDTISENGGYPLSIELYKNGALIASASCSEQQC